MNIPWLLGSNNPHKLKELIEICDIPVDWQLATDFNLPSPEENGESLEANALLKAVYYHKATDLISVADDTGLFVDCLNGAPGIHSARYAGETNSYDANRKKLLQELSTLQKPYPARFETVLAVVWNGGKWLGRGVLLGEIITIERGNNGFGYDPIFVPTGYTETLAELSPAVKNGMSHRFRAYKQLEAAYRQGYLPANLK